MISINEPIYTNVKKLPKDYQILNLRILLNKELYEDNIIPFDVFDSMQKMLLEKMNKIVIGRKQD